MVENMAYAVLIKSTSAKGCITNINAAPTENAPGLLAVITHLNAPKLNTYMQGGSVRIKLGEKLVLLQSDRVYYDGQTIGIVVAQTLEQARHAASLVHITYDEEKPTVSIERRWRDWYHGCRLGDRLGGVSCYGEAHPRPADYIRQATVKP